MSEKLNTKFQAEGRSVDLDTMLVTYAKQSLLNVPEYSALLEQEKAATDSREITRVRFEKNHLKNIMMEILVVPRTLLG